METTTLKDQLSLKLKFKLSLEEENEKMLSQVVYLKQDNTKMKQIVIDLTDSLN